MDRRACALGGNRQRKIRLRNRTKSHRRPSLGFLRLEPLEPRVLLHGNPVLDAEHLAVFGARDSITGVITGGLVPDSALTYISAPSTTPERWSDPATWIYVGLIPTDGSSPSPIPGANDNVLISSNSVVLVDGIADSPLRTIRIDGTLRFDPHANTNLSVDTIIVQASGVIHDNTIRHMGRHGINLEGRSGGSVSGVIVEENDIGFMGVDGIHLENANGNTIRDNKSNDNAGSGIQVTNSDNNIIRKNTTRRNNFGIQVNSQSDGNTFNSNTSFDNTTLDYRDSSNGAGTAGTANTWTKNKGNTANPPGLIN